VENLSEVQTQVQNQLPPIADLQDQVQLTYWSNHHFIAQSLLDQLPFGEILGSYCFYQYINYQLPSLLEAARRNLLYWTLTTIHQYNRTPVLRSKGLKDATCVGGFGDDWNCLVGCPPKAMIT